LYLNFKWLETFKNQFNKTMTMELDPIFLSDPDGLFIKSTGILQIP
jgi:hypothetical protein